MAIELQRDLFLREPSKYKSLPEDLTLIGTVELGTVVVIEALWLRLGIDQVFKEMAKSKGYKARYERALLAMTANRLCEPPKEAERERRHREQVVKDLKELLSQHKDPHATAQWAVTLKASGHYGRYLKITEDHQLCIDHKAIQQTAQYDGKWVIQTNDDTLTLEEAACGYKALRVIEQCFRSLKQTQIKMTPMFHWLPHRIEAG